MVHNQRYPKTESLLAQTRKLLQHSHLRARKGLGQHFLVDEAVLDLIISTAQLTPDDVVIEVGPGLGVLTRELVRQAGWVVAVELDNKLADLLKQTLATFENLTIVNEDVLEVDPAILLQNSGLSSRYKVVANLPYYIASPVLRHFLETEVKPQLMVVMVQKEVAEEIVAKHGRMSLLSVGVQLYAEAEIAGYVPARCFFPPPEVDSALLKVTPYPRPTVEIRNTESFFALVRAGFSAPRKQVANSLAKGLGIPKTEAILLLEKTQIAPQRRAETLTLEEWARLGGFIPE